MTEIILIFSVMLIALGSTLMGYGLGRYNFQKRCKLCMAEQCRRIEGIITKGEGYKTSIQRERIK